MDVISYPKEIQLFFNEIVDKIKDELDPEYILIAGSFGKESWLYFNDELISDFELVFVCKKAWSLKRKTKLLKQLNNDYPYEISLKGFLSDKVKNRVISNYAFKNPGYLSLDFFDTFSNPVILYNKNDVPLEVDCNVDDIPVWEAWRLYVNRMGDVLKLDCSEDYDKKIEDYYWLKIFESTAGAYCIINKIYNKNISKRLEIFSKNLIEKDQELNEICKKSFPVITKALLARNTHDLSVFECNLNINERKEIIISWMDYFQKKLLFQEESIIESNDNFYDKYLNNKLLQKKYLGFNYKFNITISNLIRLIYNPKLLSFNFKFYNNNYSWRHIILLSISSTFNEVCSNERDLQETKKIMNKITKTDGMSDDEFIKSILNYWSILR